MDQPCGNSIAHCCLSRPRKLHRRYVFFFVDCSDRWISLSTATRSISGTFSFSLIDRIDGSALRQLDRPLLPVPPKETGPQVRFPLLIARIVGSALVRQLHRFQVRFLFSLIDRIDGSALRQLGRSERYVWISPTATRSYFTFFVVD